MQRKINKPRLPSWAFEMQDEIVAVSWFTHQLSSPPLGRKGGRGSRREGADEPRRDKNRGRCQGSVFCWWGGERRVVETVSTVASSARGPDDGGGGGRRNPDRGQTGSIGFGSRPRFSDPASLAKWNGGEENDENWDKARKILLQNYGKGYYFR